MSPKPYSRRLPLLFASIAILAAACAGSPTAIPAAGSPLLDLADFGRLVAPGDKPGSLRPDEFVRRFTVADFDKYAGLVKPSGFTKSYGGLFPQEHWTRYAMHTVDVNHLVFYVKDQVSTKSYRAFWFPFIEQVTYEGHPATLKATVNSTANLQTGQVYGGAQVSQDVQVPPATSFDYSLVLVGEGGGFSHRGETLYTDKSYAPKFQRAYDPPELNDFYYHPGLAELPFSYDLVRNHAYVAYYDGNKTVDTGYGAASLVPAAWGLGVGVSAVEKPGVFTLPRSLILSDRILRDQASGEARARIIQAVIPEMNTYLGLVLTEGRKGPSLVKPEILVVSVDSAERLSALLGGKTLDVDGYDIFTRENRWGWKPDGSNAKGELYQGAFGPKGRIGKALFTSAEGQFYGSFVDDRAEGPGLLRQPDGGTVYGVWKAGLLDGPAVLKKADGSLARLVYVAGQPGTPQPYEASRPANLPPGYVWLGHLSGVAAMAASGRRVLASAELTGGQLAAFVIQDDDGRVTSARLDSSGLSGTQLRKDASVYTGRLDADLAPSGQGRFHYADGSELEGSFIAGEPDGTLIYKEASGTLSQRLYRRGLRVYAPGEKQESSQAATDVKDLVRQLKETTKQYSDYFAGTTANLERKASERDSALRLMQYGDDLAALSAKAGGSAFGNFLSLSSSQMKAAAASSPEYRAALASYDFQNSLKKGDFKPLIDVFADAAIEDRPENAGLVNFLRSATLNTLAIAENARAARARLEAESKQPAAGAQASGPSGAVNAASSSAGAGQGAAASNLRAKPQLWKNGRPAVGEDDVQLYTVVAAADHYYQQYLEALRAGRQAEADNYYEGHRASVRNAEQLLTLKD